MIPDVDKIWPLCAHGGDCGHSTWTDLDVWDVAGGRDRRCPEPEELVDADDGVDEEQDGQQHVGQEREDGPEAEVGPGLAVQRHRED